MSAVTTKSRSFALGGQVVHQVEHQIFQDHAQSARADLALQGQLRHGFQRIVGEAQAHILKLKQALILPYQRVLRFRQNAHQRALVQVAEHAEHRQAAHKFRNQAVANQVGGLHLLQQFDVAPAAVLVGAASV